MPILDFIVELMAETGRAILTEQLAGRFRRVRPGRTPRGMAAVRRHVLVRTRRKLFNRLSTKATDSDAVP